MQKSSQKVAEGALAIQRLLKLSKPTTSTSMKSAVVALFTADIQGQLMFSNLIGLLQLDTDRALKSTFLRVYDLQTLSLMFQVQLYYGFGQNYRQITGTMYGFDYPQGFVAFMFRDKTQAQIMQIKIKSQSPTLQQFSQVRKHKIENVKKEKQSTSWFGSLKKKIYGNQQQQHQSVVYNVEKLKSASFDPNTGTITTDNLPKQWMEILNHCQLDPTDLKDKEVVDIIFGETMLNIAKKQAIEKKDQVLLNKINQAQQEQKTYERQATMMIAQNLPPPPPPPPLLAPSNPRVSAISKRANLMDEIRNNNIQLKHVETKQHKIDLDISGMNRQQRMDHAQKLRIKLQKRKQALNRRESYLQ